MKFQKFVDRAPLYAKAGDGGNGACSFRREKFIPKGGPDGGDGGDGGSIILQASKDDNSLIRVFYSPHQKAESGGSGKGQQRHGRNGQDLIIRVPMGTQVYDAETEELLGDIIEDQEQFVVARGGKGGKGNVHWKSPTHQTPYEHTDGTPGEEKTLRLLLKISADVGLVGFPNAGKSSLITCMSKAHPKIGAYPFTTLNPIIGTMIFDDYTSLKVADIPGLIEGAHTGIGLGHEFLRHIERSSVLVYIIDMAGTDNREPHEDYVALRKELELYNNDLVKKKHVVVANKMDVDVAKEKLKIFIKKTGVKPLEISAKEQSGIEALRSQIKALHQSITQLD